MILDNSIATSGKIVPANKIAQEPLIDLTSFDDIAHKFDIKNNILVEKKQFRMDTKGERKGTTALELYNMKSKKKGKQRPIKQVDMFDTGMDNMLINIDKAFKGVFDIGF